MKHYDKYIKKGPNLYYSNGFIMKAEDYDRYCEFLYQVDKSKVAVQKALDETQLLFDSLMQEYFG